MKLNKSIPRVIKESRGPYIGMLYMVILSVFLFVAMLLTAQNLTYNKEIYIKDHVQEDLEFITANKIDNIAEIESKFNLLLDESLMKDFTNGNTTLRLFTPTTKVNIPAITDGEMPKVGEIAVDAGFAKAHELKVGDKYTLEDKEYTISGFVTIPNYAYILKNDGDMINNSKLFGIGIMNKDDMKSTSYLYTVKYNELSDNIYEQSKPLNEYLNDNGVQLLSLKYAKNNIKISMLDLETKFIGIYSVVLPSIILLIAIILINVILGRNIKNSMASIGTLYALGYRKKEIIKHYMNYSLIMSLCGGVIGSLAGIIAAKPLINLMLDYFSMPLKRFSYYPIYIIGAIILCMVLLYIGSYVSLKKTLSQSPISLMKNEGKVKKVNKLERAFKLEGFKFNTKFAIREQLRSIPRIIFLVYGILIATVFLMYGFMAKNSFDSYINQDANNIFKYEYEYVLNEVTTAAPPSNTERLAGVKFVPKNNLNNEFGLIGGEKNSTMITLEDKKGNKLNLEDDKFIITSTMAKKYKLKAGDRIEVINPLDLKEYSIEITDIAESDYGDYIFTSLDTFNNMFELPQGSYGVVVSQRELDMNKDSVYAVKFMGDIGEMVAEYMELINYFIYGIAIFAFIIGVIIIYIIASITVDESKDSISLMKIFGYKKKEINSMILNSGRKYVILGYLIGVPLTFIMMNFLFEFIGDLMHVNIKVLVKWPYLVIGFVIIFLTFEVSKLLCAKKIAKISLSDALKSKNE